MFGQNPQNKNVFLLLYEASSKSIATKFHIFDQILMLDFNLVHSWQREIIIFF